MTRGSSRLGGTLSVVLMLSAASGCATRIVIPATATTQRVAVIDGAYEMTRRSGLVIVGSDLLARQVEQEALAECSKQRLALAVLDKSEMDPEPPGLPSARILYRCVKP